MRRRLGQLVVGVAASTLVVGGCAVGIDAVQFDAGESGPREAPRDVTLARFDRSDNSGVDDDFLLFGAAWPRETIVVVVAEPPRIELPDLEHITNPSALVQSALGDLVTDPIDGVEVVACDTETGSASQVVASQGRDFVSDESGGGLTQLQVDGSGAGQFYSLDTGNLVTIAVDENGAGEYFNEAVGRLTTVKVAGNGGGEYFDRLSADEGLTGLSDEISLPDETSLFTLTVEPDTSARLFSEQPNRLETVQVWNDGRAEHFLEAVSDDVIVVTSTVLFVDGSWEMRRTVGDDFTELFVRADGTGMYSDSTIGRATFDETGVGDALTIGVPPRPTFSVDVRFPALGQLGQIAATCETVIRVDQELLFASGSAALSSSAGPILDRLVTTLNANGRAVTVAGHTDAVGSAESNQRLSVQRAEVVEAVMAIQGLKVGSVVVGYGETQPIAENYLPDGSANREGMAQNRRVEILIDE